VKTKVSIFEQKEKQQKHLPDLNTSSRKRAAKPAKGAALSIHYAGFPKMVIF
jgi:hypothetical protein